MVESWIFGKVADKVLEKLRGVLGFTELESEFAKATKRWATKISGEVSVNPQYFFNPNSDPVDGEDCPERLRLREMLQELSLPSAEDWHAGLMENWDIVKKRFADSEAHPFYELERDKASGYLRKLADSLYRVCTTQTDFFMVNITEKVTKIDNNVEKLIDRSKGESGAEPKWVHNLPYESLGSIFKGRGVALGRLGEVLAEGRRAAITQVGTICGLGGIGKTRLAVEFAWEGLREETFCQAYFVRCGMDDKAQGLFGEKSDDEVTDKEAATAQGRFTAAIAELAGEDIMKLGMEGKTQLEMAQAVLGELQQRDGWLVILDNVDDRAMQECILRLLPQLVKGKVIVTSRIKEWRKEEAAPILIDKLDLEDSKAYLLERTEDRRAKSDDDSALAGRMAEKLDGLPIALEQAAAYINRKRVGFAEYIEEFEKHREEVLSFADGGIWVDYPKPVLTTWQTTEEQLSKTARGLVGLMSFLGPEAIPAELFTRLDDLLKAEGKETSGVHAGLVELADWSMITYEDGQVTVHRLIQEVTRLRMDKEVYGQLCETAAKMVDDHRPADPPPSDVRSWGYWEVMAGHVEMVAGYADEQGVAEPTGRLMNQLGVFLYAQARYAEAEPMHRRALEIDETSFGADHPNVAYRLNNLAGLFCVTDRVNEAEPLYRRAVTIFEKSLGADHPNTVTVRRNLELLKN